MKSPRYALFLWVCPFVLVLGQAVQAQQAPSAGSQLQQIPAPVTRPTLPPDLRVEPPERSTTTSSDTSTVEVKALRLVGAQAFPDTELLKVSGFIPGSRYTVNDLRALAAHITTHYRGNGYFLAQTFLPTQDITEGVVQLTVVEGQYGRIHLKNRSGLQDGVAHFLLDGLKPSGAANASTLERRLLVLSDLPGILVKSVLTPGTDVGTTDLMVDIAPGPSTSGSVEADNQGNSYTGINRLGASLSINEPTGHGDVATARVLTSGEGLAYGRVSYQTQLGWTSVGLAYTTLRYQLGGDFAATQSSGTARLSTVFANYPVIRSRSANLTAQWSLDNKDFSDRVDAGAPGGGSDKHAQVSTWTLKGDIRDAWRNGFSTYSLAWTRGRIDLQSAVMLQSDSVTAQSQGSFDKISYALTHQEAVAGNTALFVGLSGQWASKNLDASEKFSLGGATGVRAYPSGEASGDEGALLALESRTDVTGWLDGLPGQLQLIGFLDAGTVSLNKNPWDDTTSNRRVLRGGGLGVNYVAPGNWVLKAYYAFKWGTEPATSAPDVPGRLWVQAQKYY